jgi:hypothetical protein
VTSVFGRKLNRGIAIALALVALAFVVDLVARGIFGPWTPLAVLVVWSYPLAAIFLVEWAWGRLHHRGVPAIPGLSDATCRRRGPWIALAGWVLLVTLAREGAFAPGFVLGVNWWNATDTWSGARNTSSNGVTTGTEAPAQVFAGQPLSCTASCTSPGEVCETVVRELGCDPDASTMRTGTFRITVEDPWCYLPLRKQATLHVSLDGDLFASLDADQRDAEGLPRWHIQRSVSLSIDGTLAGVMTGVSSCFAFRRHLGHELAGRLRDEINATLAES